MGTSLGIMFRLLRATVATVFVGSFVGCGTLGAPVPPEYVGVGPLIEKQKAKEKAAADAARRAEAERTFTADEARSERLLDEEPIMPPPLYPVGTR
ncbi:MAG: hypothetical protein U0172_09170 [Nitrospiraceae bacterium]